MKGIDANIVPTVDSLYLLNLNSYLYATYNQDDKWGISCRAILTLITNNDKKDSYIYKYDFDTNYGVNSADELFEQKIPEKALRSLGLMISQSFDEKLQ
jgi:hypothetical protein